MPLQKIQLRPGVNREGTTLANEGGYFDGDKIRFRSGFPEKIGGWVNAAVGTFLGVARSLFNWVTLSGFNLLGVGTNLKFYVQPDGGAFYDITPIRFTSAAGAATFAATNGSPTILVTNTTGAGFQTGDFVTFSGAVSLGGNITAAILNQEYQITFVSSTTFTIQARAVSSITTPGAAVNANASDTGNGGGSTVATYQINTGQAIFTLGTGWGAGPWGGVVSSALSTTLNGNLTAVATSVVVANTTGFSTAGLILVGNANASGIKTSLPTGIDNAVTTITVLSTNYFGVSTPADQYRFADSGSILIDTEIITYTGLGSTGTTFTGCTRGASGTSAASHAAGAVVYQNALEDISYTGITPTTTFTTATRGADGTFASPFPTGSIVYKADSFPGWGDGFSTGIGQQLRLWSQSNFGQILLFSARGGPFYQWDPGSGTQPAYGTRGTVVSGTNVPSLVNEIMVSAATRIVICFGCNDPAGTYGTVALDPMLIRWSAQEDYTNWTPATTNQAGDYRLSHGSVIVGALQTRQEIVVWTDAAVYAMQYLGPPYVWGFTLLADNISITSPNAMATANGVIYWMGTDKFYVYSGRVETLPCSVRTYVYSNINTEQYAQIFAGTNEGFSEVWWFYCSSGATSPDRYVIFNYLDRVWYYGTLDRTAWSDSAIRVLPQATTSGNLLVNHESGADDGTTNPPSAISSFIQSSDFDIDDGHNYGFVWRMIPDITFDGSTTAAPNLPSVNFQLRPRQNPGANYGVANTPLVQSKDNYATQNYYNVQQFTEIVYTRVRGRQMAFKILSDGLGVQWQLGVPRIDIRPDGKR